MDLANQQSQASQQLLAQQTEANRPNQSTPWGNTSWTSAYDPSTGGYNWSENESLNPNEQKALTEQQQGAATTAGAAGNLWNTSGVANGLNFSGAPEVHAGNYYTPEAQNAVWNEFQTMQQPLQEQQTQSQQAQLEAQGLRPGDAAYDTSMKNLSNTQYQQDQSAEDQAVLAGEQEAAQMQGMDVQAQNQYINKQTAQQEGNLNMYNTMMGTTGNLQVPQFGQAGVGQTPDYLGAAESQYGSQLNAANAANAQNANLWSGIGQMGATAAMAYALS